MEIARTGGFNVGGLDELEGQPGHRSDGPKHIADEPNGAVFFFVLSGERQDARCQVDNNRLFRGDSGVYPVAFPGREVNLIMGINREVVVVDASAEVGVLALDAAQSLVQLLEEVGASTRCAKIEGTSWQRSEPSCREKVADAGGENCLRLSMEE